jgi:16S rRNA (cytosine967-C5)-methyltransferase
MRLAPGQVALDLCAGLGTKTTQMAEMMRDQGRVLATDKDAPKLEALTKNCARLGLRSVVAVRLEELAARVASLDRLDWILIDVPCSNSGVLSRRPEAKYRISGASLAALSRTQRQLLARAAALARPETRLVYSTCSIEPEENEQTVDAFAAGHRQWRMIERCLTLPDAGDRPEQWCDGGYWSSWRSGPE